MSCVSGFHCFDANQPEPLPFTTRCECGKWSAQDWLWTHDFDKCEVLEEYWQDDWDECPLCGAVVIDGMIDHRLEVFDQ